jgi:hypothetical protein
MEKSMETQLAVHEAVCTQRYENILKQLDDGDKRMNKIEYLIYATIFAVLFGPGVAAEFIKKLFGL